MSDSQPLIRKRSPNCPTDATLQAFLDGSLDTSELDTVGKHIESCTDCRQYCSDYESKAIEKTRTVSPEDLPATDIRAFGDRGQSMQDFEVSERIGPYKILQPIGKGGMGAVFMAEQTEPVKRRVALKVIKTDTPTKEILARFEAERQALAMMDHQNIAKVLDAGITEDGRPYFAMELVKGVPITEYCDNNRLNPNERLDLFVQTCRAIQHAHMKGIVHRDIKPSNVLVTLYDGKPVAKVIDFGLAKALRDTAQLTNRTLFTQYGQVVGTLAYMSPEQAEMNALDVDSRTDVYSLGVIFYELLTGSTPITREKIKSEAFDRILALIREEEALRPSRRLSESGELIAGISDQRKVEPKRLSLMLRGDLDWIAVKALEKDRTRRYDTPAALADDVQRYLDDEAIEARPPSFGYRLQKAIRKNKGKFIAGTSLVCMLIAGLVGTGTMWWRASTAREAAKAAEATAIAKTATAQAALSQVKKERDRADKQAVAADVAAKRAQDSEASALFQLANARWEVNRAGAARDLLHKIPRQYRDNFEWQYSNREFLGSDMTLYGHTSAVLSVSFSPDGTRIASGSWDKAIKLWDADTGQEIKTLKGQTGAVDSLSFSPDGTRIAAENSRAIKLWDVDSGQAIKTLKGHPGVIKTVVFSPDGTCIATGSVDRTIKLWDVDSGQEIKTLEGHTDWIVSLSFSPDGTRLASGSRDKMIKLWDVETGEEVKTLTGHTGTVESVSFSPDGTRIASGSVDHMIKLWDVSSGQEIKTLKGHTSWVYSLSFSPDGTHIASGSLDSTVKLWNARTGAEIKTLKGHTDAVVSVSFSPDGTRIVSGSVDTTVKVWDATTGEKMKSLRGHTKTVHAAVFSPKGDVASGSGDRTIRLWDVNTGQEVRTLKGHTSSVYGLSFSPDGKRIASGSLDKTVKLWDADTGVPIKTLKGHTDGVGSVSFSPDGTRIASGSVDTTVKVWDADTGQGTRTLTGHSRPVRSVSFSPDGTRIASGSFDATVKLWDVDTGEELTTLKGHKLLVGAVSFSPDGTQIASGGYDEVIKLWDVNTGQELMTLKGHTAAVTSISFSPDGTRIVSNGGTIKLWNVRTGEEIKTLARDSGPVCFSLDGKCIIFGSSEYNIKLLEAGNDYEVKTLTGHTGDILSVSFSQDGNRLYSRSDKERFVWDFKTGSILSNVEWINNGNRIRHGKWLAVPSGDTVLLVDTEFKNTPREKAYRAFKANPKPWWHQERLITAIETKDWYAAAFHAGWLFRRDPGSRTNYDQFQTTWANIDAAKKLLLPTSITEVAKLPKPPITEVTATQAQSRNSALWKAVVAPDAEPTDSDFEWMQAVVRDWPRGVYFNTLGVALYRAGKYRDSVAACLKSVELTPQQDDRYDSPLAGDFAFLAMSHFQLGNKEEANKYRKQLTDAMKLDVFKDDKECLGFAKEVDELFDGDPSEEPKDAEDNK